LYHSPVINANGGYATDVTGAIADQRFENSSAVFPNGVKLKLHRDTSATQDLDDSLHLCLHPDAKKFVL